MKYIFDSLMFISLGMHIGYCWESQKEREHWGDQNVVGRKLLKWMLER
jgi:hypothetical protein